jgi:hypothetical protein
MMLNIIMLTIMTQSIMTLNIMMLTIMTQHNDTMTQSIMT